MACRNFVLFFLFFFFAEGMAAGFAGEQGGSVEEIIILGERAKQIETEIPGNVVRVDQVWEDTDNQITLTVNDHKKVLKLLVRASKTGRQLVSYTLVPWQNFTVNHGMPGSLPLRLKATFLTVTGCAVIYVSYPEFDLTEKENAYVEVFDKGFKDIIDYKSCSSEMHDAELDIPEGVQLLSVKIFPFYINLQVALPGSVLPEQFRWGKVTEDRMLCVSLVPDMGETRILWFKPVWVNKINKEVFGGYIPKITPDTAEDFMPALSETLQTIPEAEPGSLNHLISLFIKYKNNAAENPGCWEAGNMLLGARKKEYIPSEDEILLSETGNRLKHLIGSDSKDWIKMELKEKYSELPQLEYVRFTFTHVDVMGSGRFYYIDTMVKVRIPLTDYAF